MSLTICTIGCGKHSAYVHGPSCARYAREHEGTRLAACCDLDPARAEGYRRAFGYERAYTDLDEMLLREKPDAVCVIVPERHICGTAIHVMKKGFAVLMEKPPGLCRAETERMIEAAEAAGVINQVAFNRRAMPLMRRMRQMLCAPDATPPQNLFYEFYRCGRREPTFETTAIHGIDAARYLMGCDYREARFTYQELPGQGDRVVNILMECRFENGAVGTLHFCPCTGAVLERVTVTAEDHTWFLTTPIWDGCDAPGALTHLLKGRPVERIGGEELSESQDMFETNGFYGENEEFFECVRSGRPSGNDLRSTLQSVILAEAIRDRLTHCAL